MPTISRIGIAFALTYVVAAIGCVLLGYFSTDPKGSFVFLQLPLLPLTAVFYAFGQGTLLHGLTFPQAYAIFGLPTIVMCYAIGHGLGYLAERLCQADS